MKYPLALFVMVLAVACSGASDTAEPNGGSANVAGDAVDDVNLEEINKELEEIESELNLDKELENLEVSLE